MPSWKNENQIFPSFPEDREVRRGAKGKGPKVVNAPQRLRESTALFFFGCRFCVEIGTVAHWAQLSLSPSSASGDKQKRWSPLPE